jgi:hypothetical protein
VFNGQIEKVGFIALESLIEVDRAVDIEVEDKKVNARQTMRCSNGLLQRALVLLWVYLSTWASKLSSREFSLAARS